MPRVEATPPEVINEPALHTVTHIMAKKAQHMCVLICTETASFTIQNTQHDFCNYGDETQLELGTGKVQGTAG